MITQSFRDGSGQVTGACENTMTRFYKPDLGANPDSPFVRDGGHHGYPRASKLTSGRTSVDHHGT